MGENSSTRPCTGLRHAWQRASQVRAVHLPQVSGLPPSPGGFPRRASQPCQPVGRWDPLPAAQATPLRLDRPWTDGPLAVDGGSGVSVWEHEHQTGRELSGWRAPAEFSADLVEFNEQRGREDSHTSPGLFCLGVGRGALLDLTRLSPTYLCYTVCL